MKIGTELIRETYWQRTLKDGGFWPDGYLTVVRAGNEGIAAPVQNVEGTEIVGDALRIPVGNGRALSALPSGSTFLAVTEDYAYFIAPPAA